MQLGQLGETQHELLGPIQVDTSLRRDRRGVTATDEGRKYGRINGPTKFFCRLLREVCPLHDVEHGCEEFVANAGRLIKQINGVVLDRFLKALIDRVYLAFSAI